jgi:hypothetical protein
MVMSIWFKALAHKNKWMKLNYDSRRAISVHVVWNVTQNFDQFENKWWNISFLPMCTRTIKNSCVVHPALESTGPELIFET